MDFQRLTQVIGRAVWLKLNAIHSCEVQLDFNHLQIEALNNYGIKLWMDCLTLEKLWLAGEIVDLINLEDEILEIAHLQPWSGTPAILASDRLFSLEAESRQQKRLFEAIQIRPLFVHRVRL